MKPSLARVTFPPRHAGVIVCPAHLVELDGIDLRSEPITQEAAAFHGHHCLMCSVEPVPGRSCANERCRRTLHPQWPAVYCSNDCAMEDV